ncbi:hypothetical protein GCM10023093_22200 [Nemorincola caseinilytica]|uniref:Secretion system C-terminal sorting domain-containing protein n=2 Tax=Nemorincola caseinilytica TaxID=2054315 RepID=A0ABP8NKX3_9BACT
MIVAGLLFLSPAYGQITITGADMPVHRDTLRFSNASATDVLSWAADSGTGKVWNYTLFPTSQGLDEYKRPAEVNPALVGSLFIPGITADYAYGPKMADSIPGIGLIASGVTIKDLHTYFNCYVTPPAFVAEAFSATISGFPVGADYTLPDVWYRLPLTYGDSYNADFHLKFGAAVFGSIEQKGNRKTRVDGWGTITTPYFTTPTPCLRVRSEINEIDSIDFSGQTFGIERTTIEYRWMVKGEHQPALMISAISLADTEIVTTVRYKDRYRPEFSTAVATATPGVEQVNAFPNPATDGHVRFDMPAAWKQYVIELFDVQGRKVGTWVNRNELDITQLVPGNYMARITAGSTLAYVRLTR